MPRYVQDGSLDCGLTGYDWILENDAKVVEVAELVFSKVSRRPVRWVLAVPNDSPIQSVKDLQGKRIATEVVEPDAALAGRARRRRPTSNSAGAPPRSSRRAWPTPSSR